MKNLVLSLFVSLATFTAIAQQTVTFKMGYKPLTSYTQSNVQTTKNEVSYKGTDEILASLEAQGIQNPTVTENKTTINSVVTTGKLAGVEMPVTMKLSVDNGAGNKIVPDGTMVYGKAKQEGLPVFDSINAPGMEANIKDIFLKSMQASISQLAVPEKKVKVGETFTVNLPLSLPMGPATLKMDDAATYKLIKVEGRKAYFDVTHVYIINSEVNGEQLKGTGTGSGKIVHDLDNNYFLKQDMTMDMEMGFETNGITLTIKAKTTSALTCVIAPVK
jgi:hypothetical protein